MFPVNLFAPICCRIHVYMGVFWIRSSCVVKNKTLKWESNSWNIQSMDTTESKTNLVDRNTFTISLKMSHKASESIKVFCRMDNFFVRCILSNIFCFQRLCKKSLLGVRVTFSYRTFLWATCYVETIVWFCKESSVLQIFK